MFHIIFHFLIPSISQKVGEEGRAPPWFIVLIRVSSECLGNEFVMSPIKPVISPSRAIIKSGAIKSWLAAVHVPDHTRPEHHSHLCCIDQTASLLQMSQCPLETAYSKCAGFYSTVFFFISCLLLFPTKGTRANITPDTSVICNFNNPHIRTETAVCISFA